MEIQAPYGYALPHVIPHLWECFQPYLFSYVLINQSSFLNTTQIFFSFLHFVASNVR